MGKGSIRVTTEYTPGGGRVVRTDRGISSINAAPPAIPGVTIGQVLGWSSVIVTANVPALAANVAQDATFTAALTGLPNPFTLSPNTSGQIIASVALSAAPTDATTVVGVPVISLTFGIGGTTDPGSTIWELFPSVNYQAPGVTGSVRCFSPSGADAQTLSLLVQALLVALPAAL